MSGLRYGFESSTPSLFDPNNLVELPSQLTQYTPESVVEVAVDHTGTAATNTGRNAVIQAGGNVSITAAQQLESKTCSRITCQTSTCIQVTPALCVDSENGHFGLH